MKTFIYVVCWLDQKIKDPGCMRFEHCTVNAEDEDDAYCKGQELLIETKQLPGRLMFNDYVIELQLGEQSASTK